MFIAVIIETFAEIRVQFQQMWGARELEAQVEHNQVKFALKLDFIQLDLTLI